MVTVSAVTPHSLAARKGMRAGDVLCALNGHDIADVLDYRFYLAATRVRLAWTRAGRRFVATLDKAEEADIGLEFDTYLMDTQRACRNRCVFCFIDQLPPGLRESLYFKDDDSRLSFLFGNYITLTNLTEREASRLIEMRISPVNVSVHTTDPDLRCEMMGNRFAGESLALLERFAGAGLALNCQLVLCPGWNDGDALERTLRDLLALGDAVRSIAAVPVGLTRHRAGLTPLRPFTAAEAATVLDTLERHGAEMLCERSERVVYPADEWFLRAGRPLPEADYYDDFPQLENGVGMLSLWRREFYDALDTMPTGAAGEATKDRLLLATGVAAAPFLRELVAAAGARWPGLRAEVVAVRNDFFGEQITVAGLVTGGDLIAQVREHLRELGADRLLIPASMLRREGDVFLDDVSVADVEAALGMPVSVVVGGGEELARQLTMNNEQ